MKKTLLATAIAVTALASVNAQADIAITNMDFGPNAYASAGSLLDAGGGAMNSIDNFSFHSWTASQQTLFMDNTGAWANNATKSTGAVSSQGFYDYDAEIAGMTSGQVAVGLFFNWFGNNDIAVLEIFDCTTGPDVCLGNGVPMANGPFGSGNADGTPDGTGSIAIFSGTGTATVVPVPAAVWLMGSGLLGLVGVARRRKQA